MIQNDSSFSPLDGGAGARFLSLACTGPSDEEMVEADFEEVIALFLVIEPEYRRTNQLLAGL